MQNTRVFNLGAGPAMMPLSVLEDIKNGFMDFGGMSVLEISHRSRKFFDIMDETQSLFKEILAIPSNYHILLLAGGASMQFAMVPLNLMENSADYVATGYWASRAIEEAACVGKPKIIFTSEKDDFSRVPKADEIFVSKKASYLHITTNNSIHGTQYKEFPKTDNVPVVADMTSDLLTRKINVSDFGLIYASAQKNFGAAGVTAVIIRDDLAKLSFRKLPRILCYSLHVENGSIFNTPPVFSIYVALNMLKWLKDNGGLAKMEETNRKKSEMIYSVIDNSRLYKGRAEKDCRSLVNISFGLSDDALTGRFIAEASEAGFVGLSGHRMTGGVRASMYNAFPVEGAKALADFMKNFEKRI